MPGVSWSEEWAYISAVAALMRENFEYGSQNTPNFDALQETLIEAIKGDQGPRKNEAMRSVRAAMATACNAHPGLLEPALDELMRIIKSTATSRAQRFEDLAYYMHTSPGSLTVKSRGVSHGSFASGSGNVAKGISGATVLFVDKDKRGYTIEDAAAHKVYARCTADRNTAGLQSGVATFRMFCSGIITDGVVSQTAKPELNDVQSRPAETSIIQNGGMRATGSGTHKWTPWLVSGADYTGIVSSTSGYRIEAGSVSLTNLNGIRRSVKVSANKALYQIIPSELETTRPYVGGVHVRSESGFDGTIILALGSRRVTRAAAGTSGVWTNVYLSGASTSWYESFKQSPLAFEVYVSGRTAGYVLLDNAYLHACDYYNGRYFIIKPGRTDYEVNDQWSWQTSVTNDRGIQGALNRAFPGFYVPHIASGFSISDPA